jgi:hypothetical protein
MTSEVAMDFRIWRGDIMCKLNAPAMTSEVAMDLRIWGEGRILKNYSPAMTSEVAMDFRIWGEGRMLVINMYYEVVVYGSIQLGETEDFE